MESIYTTQRPSLLLAPACAPSAVLPVVTTQPSLITAAPPVAMATPPVAMAAQRTPLSQVHQVQIQAELGWTEVLGDSGNSTAGLRTSKAIHTSKAFPTKATQGTGVSVNGAAGGVPPRGRPV